MAAKSEKTGNAFVETIKTVVYALLIAGVFRTMERTIGHRFDEIAPRATITATGAPVLLVHGTADDLVPLARENLRAAQRDVERQMARTAVFREDREGE